jgi:hypothetical protein
VAANACAARMPAMVTEAMARSTSSFRIRKVPFPTGSQQG